MKIIYLMILFILSSINNLSASCFHQQSSKYCKSYGPYTGINSGFSILNISAKKSHASFKPGYFFDGFFGYRFPNQLKIEGEIGYQKSQVDHFTNCFRVHIKKATGHVESWLYMVNSIYEINSSFVLKPYFGIGLGYGYSKGYWKSREKNGLFSLFNPGFFNIEYKKSGFAWQPIVGINYEISENFNVGIDYRFIRIDNDIKTHKIGLILTGFF